MRIRFYNENIRVRRSYNENWQGVKLTLDDITDMVCDWIEGKNGFRSDADVEQLGGGRVSIGGDVPNNIFGIYADVFEENGNVVIVCHGIDESSIRRWANAWLLKEIGANAVTDEKEANKLFQRLCTIASDKFFDGEFDKKIIQRNPDSDVDVNAVMTDCQWSIQHAYSALKEVLLGYCDI